MMHGNIIDNGSSAVKNLIKKGSFDKAYVSLKKCNGLTNEMVGVYNREYEGAIAYSEWEVTSDKGKIILRERTSFDSGGGGDDNCCCSCCCYLLSGGAYCCFCSWCCDNPETVLDCFCNCCCGC